MYDLLSADARFVRLVESPDPAWDLMAYYRPPHDLSGVEAALRACEWIGAVRSRPSRLNLRWSGLALDAALVECALGAALPEVAFPSDESGGRPLARCLAFLNMAARERSEMAADAPYAEDAMSAVERPAVHGVAAAVESWLAARAAADEHVARCASVLGGRVSRWYERFPLLRGSDLQIAVRCRVMKAAAAVLRRSEPFRA